MGLMQEGLRRSGEIRNALTPVNPAPTTLPDSIKIEERALWCGVNLNPSEIKTNRLPVAEAGLEGKIGETSRMLSVEEKEGKETEELQPQETGKNGFEPFISGGENDENNLFVNLYGGNFSQKMELNRKGLERVLKIAHLDGQVFLTTLSPNRQRSSEAQGDTLVVKRDFVSLEKVEEENPYTRIVSIPEGWRIEVNDTRITDELTEKKLGGKQLQRAFINRFNSQLKSALKECVWREKFSSEKDNYFKRKLFFSLLPILGQAAIQAIFYINPLFAMSSILASTLLLYGNISLTGKLFSRKIRNMENVLKELDPSFNPRRFFTPRQNFDSFWEYLMPHVEIDKVARVWAFLSLKGKKLVREIKIT